MVLFGTQAPDTAMSRDIPRILTDDEADALLDALNCRYDSGLKNTCMFRLMLEAGLRVSEVAELRRCDVDMTACRVTIRNGKGDKDRQVWVSEGLRDRIDEWLDRRPDTPDGWMFPTRTGRQTSPRSIRRSLKTYAERAELDDWGSVSPHTLRQTFATNLLRQTGNIRLVQKALGHARLSTTMIYTHIVDDELEAAMRA